MGPWGADGGTAFDITELPRSLQTMTIRCGDVINSIGFSYTDQAGQKKIAGPWGGDGALSVTVSHSFLLFQCNFFNVFCQITLISHPVHVLSLN